MLWPLQKKYSKDKRNIQNTFNVKLNFRPDVGWQTP